MNVDLQPNDHILSNYREIYLKSLRLLKCTQDNVEAERLLTDALDAIKQTFDELTGHSCVCTLKMLNPDDSVSTFIRDRMCPVDRYYADIQVRRFPAQMNSAFRELTTSFAHKYTHFISNNLSSHDHYDNVNPEWRKHYNACIVAAIRPPVSSLDRRHEIIGFLCIDNAYGGFSQPAAMTLVVMAYEMFAALSGSMSIDRYQLT